MSKENEDVIGVDEGTEDVNDEGCAGEGTLEEKGDTSAGEGTTKENKAWADVTDSEDEGTFFAPKPNRSSHEAASADNEGGSRGMTRRGGGLSDGFHQRQGNGSGSFRSRDDYNQRSSRGFGGGSSSGRNYNRGGGGSRMYLEISATTIPTMQDINKFLIDFNSLYNIVQAQPGTFSSVRYLIEIHSPRAYDDILGFHKRDHKGHPVEVITTTEAQFTRRNGRGRDEGNTRRAFPDQRQISAGGGSLTSRAFHNIKTPSQMQQQRSLAVGFDKRRCDNSCSAASAMVSTGRVNQSSDDVCTAPPAVGGDSSSGIPYRRTASAQAEPMHNKQASGSVVTPPIHPRCGRTLDIFGTGKPRDEKVSDTANNDASTTAPSSACPDENSAPATTKPSEHSSKADEPSAEAVVAEISTCERQRTVKSYASVCAQACKSASATIKFNPQPGKVSILKKTGSAACSTPTETSNRISTSRNGNVSAQRSQQVGRRYRQQSTNDYSSNKGKTSSEAYKPPA